MEALRQGNRNSRRQRSGTRRSRRFRRNALPSLAGCLQPDMRLDDMPSRKPPRQDGFTTRPVITLRKGDSNGLMGRNAAFLRAFGAPFDPRQRFCFVNRITDGLFRLIRYDHGRGRHPGNDGVGTFSADRSSGGQAIAHGNYRKPPKHLAAPWVRGRRLLARRRFIAARPPDRRVCARHRRAARWWKSPAAVPPSIHRHERGVHWLTGTSIHVERAMATSRPSAS